jgi:hypothetical protein
LVPERLPVPGSGVNVLASDVAIDGSHVWLELESEEGGRLEIAIRASGSTHRVGRATSDARFALRGRTSLGETFVFNSDGQHVEFSDA